MDTSMVIGCFQRVFDRFEVVTLSPLRPGDECGAPESGIVWAQWEEGAPTAPTAASAATSTSAAIVPISSRASFEIYLEREPLHSLFIAGTAVQDSLN